MNIFARACVCVWGDNLFLWNKGTCMHLEGGGGGGSLNQCGNVHIRKKYLRFNQTVRGLRFLFSQVGLWRN